MMRIAFTAALMVVAAAGGAGAWGSAGHSIVAELAERRLSPRALAEVAVLLGGHKSLASVSSWADEVQALRPGTRNWHFVNIPVAADGYAAARDCGEKPGGQCIVLALEQMRAVLADRAKPAAQRAEALMFIVHLVADIHQPLHCADRNDGGGVQLAVRFFGQAMSLHHLWDVALIERRTFYWGEYVRVLEQQLPDAAKTATLARGTAVEWANEAHAAARATAYVLPSDGELGEDYVTAARPVLERQLTLAGLRLARLLNEALTPPARPARHR